jgi:hypothetical protein
MIAVKQGLLAKTMYPRVTEACVFYMDLRTWGKASDAYARQAETAGVRFVRARVHSLAPGLRKEADDAIRVAWLDPSGERKESLFDLVVLAPGQHPDAFLTGFAKDQELAVDDWGFVRPEPFLPAHTSRPGIFVCGSATGPKDIHDSVTGATAAALSAMQVMAAAGRGLASGPALNQTTHQAPGKVPGKGPDRVPGQPPDQIPDETAGSHPRSGGVSIFPGALVIGGGIAGMTAALAIADQGFEVDLVEQTKELGGNLVWLQSGIEGAADFLARQMAAVQAGGSPGWHRSRTQRTRPHKFRSGTGWWCWPWAGPKPAQHRRVLALRPREPAFIPSSSSNRPWAAMKSMRGRPFRWPWSSATAAGNRAGITVPGSAASGPWTRPCG